MIQRDDPRQCNNPNTAETRWIVGGNMLCQVHLIAFCKYSFAKIQSKYLTYYYRPCFVLCSIMCCTQSDNGNMNKKWWVKDETITDNHQLYSNINVKYLRASFDMNMTPEQSARLVCVEYWSWIVSSVQLFNFFLKRSKLFSTIMSMSSVGCMLFHTSSKSSKKAPWKSLPSSSAAARRHNSATTIHFFAHRV